MGQDTSKIRVPVPEYFQRLPDVDEICCTNHKALVDLIINKQEQSSKDILQFTQFYDLFFETLNALNDESQGPSVGEALDNYINNQAVFLITLLNVSVKITEQRKKGKLNLESQKLRKIMKKKFMAKEISGRALRTCFEPRHYFDIGEAMLICITQFEKTNHARFSMAWKHVYSVMLHLAVPYAMNVMETGKKYKEIKFRPLAKALQTSELLLLKVQGWKSAEGKISLPTRFLAVIDVIETLHRLLNRCVKLCESLIWNIPPDLELSIDSVNKNFDWISKKVSTTFSKLWSMTKPRSDNTGKMMASCILKLEVPYLILKKAVGGLRTSMRAHSQRMSMLAGRHDDWSFLITDPEAREFWKEHCQSQSTFEDNQMKSEPALRAFVDSVGRKNSSKYFAYPQASSQRRRAALCTTVKRGSRTHWIIQNNLMEWKTLKRKYQDTFGLKLTYDEDAGLRKHLGVIGMTGPVAVADFNQTVNTFGFPFEHFAHVEACEHSRSEHSKTRTIANMNEQRNDMNIVKEKAQLLIYKGDIEALGEMILFEEERVLGRFADNQNLLHIAAIYGDGPVISYLMSCEETLGLLNQIDDMGYAPVHHSVVLGRLKVTELLLSKTAPSVLRQLPPLRVAAQAGRHKMVDFLLEHLDEQLNETQQAVALTHATLGGHTKLMKNLMSRGPKLTKPTMRKVFEAAVDSDEPEVMRMLLEVDKNSSISLPKGDHLQRAACVGTPDMVKTLLDQGSDEKQESEAMLSAVENGNLATTIFLSNAVPRSLEATDAQLNSPLHLAASGGDSEMAHVLTHVGVDVNKQNLQGHTPMMEAIVHKSEDVLETLAVDCAHVVNFDVQNNKKQTALHLGLEHHNPRVVEKLLGGGADTNIQDQDGKTPLHVACGTSQLNEVALLLDHGADMMIKDVAGDTAITLTASMKNKDMLSVLIQKDKSQGGRALKQARGMMDAAPSTPVIMCVGCDNQIKDKFIKTKSGDRYHHGCLRCVVCGEALRPEKKSVCRDGKYLHVSCAKKNQQLCPVCEKKVSGWIINFNDAKYHKECFTCFGCQESLSYGYYIRNGRPHCERCSSEIHGHDDLVGQDADDNIDYETADRPKGRPRTKTIDLSASSYERSHKRRPYSHTL